MCIVYFVNLVYVKYIECRLIGLDYFGLVLDFCNFDVYFFGGFFKLVGCIVNCKIVIEKLVVNIVECWWGCIKFGEVVFGEELNCL